MKKLIILIFMMLSLSSISQTIDTSNFAFALDENGFYSELVNRTTYQGIPAGSFRVPISFEYNSIDTSLWNITRGKDGFYSHAVNKDVFYGKDTATVRLQLIYPTGSPNYTTYGIDIDTTGGSYNITANTLAGEIQYLAGGTGQTIAASSSVSIAITNSKVTANSKVIVNIHEKSNGIPVISYYKVEDSQITVLINNLDASNAVEGFSIRFFIIK